MAIDLKISHEERLVLATVSGDARRGHFLKMIQSIVEANAIPYRKIVDIRFVPLDYKMSDFREFGQIVSALARNAKPGPAAIIVNSEISGDFAELFRRFAEAEEWVEVFTDLDRARAWLDQVAPSPA